DFEELGEEIGRIVEEAIGDMDWDELGEDIREATEEIVPDVEDFHLYFNFNDETFEDDIQKYTDKIHDAAEILRKAVDRKREKLNAHHSNFQRSLQESLSELGLKLERLGRMDDEKDEESSEGAKEQFERAARLRDREAARAFRKRMELERILEEGDEKPQQELLHELQQQQEEIKVRDETLHSLKKEIKMLKEEIKQMKQEQKSRREETENSEEIKPAQSGRQVCEVSIHP
ncbi:MAG: hypothetical protein KJ645_09855, partial [Planctomycetes bacterium]|nr:hypothetical protein [Planctomycetota bacterium]